MRTVREVVLRRPRSGMEPKKRGKRCPASLAPSFERPATNDSPQVTAPSSPAPTPAGSGSSGSSALLVPPKERKADPKAEVATAPAITRRWCLGIPGVRPPHEWYGDDASAGGS